MLSFFLPGFYMFAFKENAHTPTPFHHVLCLDLKDFSETLFPSHFMMYFERLHRAFSPWLACTSFS